ncbi:MAG: hypothetical protein AAF557_00285 [Pseudomonadota bacterium]
MLDLTALEILDTAMPVNTDAAPTERGHLQLVDITVPDDTAPKCPHLARIAAE